MEFGFWGLCRFSGEGVRSQDGATGTVAEGGAGGVGKRLGPADVAPAPAASGGTGGGAEKVREGLGAVDAATAHAPSSETMGDRKELVAERVGVVWWFCEVMKPVVRRRSATSSNRSAYLINHSLGRALKAWRSSRYTAETA